MKLQKLIGQKVTHTTHGDGKIHSISETNVSIIFPKDGLQFFSFPNTFRNNILRFVDIDHDEVLASLDKKEEPEVKAVFQEETPKVDSKPVRIKEKPQVESKPIRIKQEPVKEEVKSEPIRIKQQEPTVEVVEVTEKPAIRIVEQPNVEEKTIKEEPVIEEVLDQVEEVTPIEVIEESYDELDIGVEFLDEADQTPVIDTLEEEDFEEPLEEDDEKIEIIVRDQDYEDESLEKETGYNYDVFLGEFYEYVKNKKLFTFIVVKYVNDEAIFNELKSLVLKIILETLDRDPKEEEKSFVTLFIAMVAYLHFDGGLWPYIEDELQEIYQIKDRDEVNKTIKMLIDDKTLAGEDSVLLHAGIFVKFFHDYYSLMYDIYSLNFDYTLEKTPVEEILTDTFVGLRRLLLKDDSEEIYLRLTNRTYYIAKPTKQALVHSPEELAKVTKHFLRHIDLWYHKEEFDESENDFYKALKLWLDVESSRLTKILTSTKSHVVKSTYKMKPSTKEVYLAFPVIFLKGLRDFDYRRLEVEMTIGNTKEKLVIDSDYRIYRRIGYNTISIVDYLVKKPLEQLSLTIYYNKEPLYTTDEKLHRSFIIFDEDGTEIFNETDYEGFINLVHDKYERVLDAKEHNFPEHTVSEFKVNKSRTYRLGETRLSFKKALTIGLNGRVVKGLTALVNSKSYIVYKELENFVFESTLKAKDIVMELNDETYPLIDVVPYDNTYGENFQYEVLLEKLELKSDIYHLVIKDLSGIIIKEIDFLYDKNLKIIKNIKKLPLIYDFSINSSFNVIENKKYNYDFSRRYDIHFEFKLRNQTIKYLIDFNIPRYKYNLKETWRAFDDLELKSDVLILSRDCSKALVKWPNEDPLELHMLEIGKEFKKFNLKPLYNFELPKENNVKVEVTFEDGTKEELTLYVIPEVISKPKALFTQKGNLMLNFDVKCFDPDRWTLEIIDSSGRNKTHEFTHQKSLLRDFLPYEEYNIKIREKRSSSFGSTPDVFYEDTFIFVDNEGLFGKTFLINSASYIDEEQLNQTVELRPFAIKFLRKVSRTEDSLKETSLDINNVCYRCELYRVGRNNQLTRLEMKERLYCEVLTERSNPMLRIKIEDRNGDKVSVNLRRRTIEERIRPRNVLINQFMIDTLKDIL